MPNPQFPLVNCERGAPMGRTTFGTPEHAENKIRVFQVNIDSGGYDDGGAYWGLGKPLYCATDGADYRQFTRATTRLEAVAKLEIPRAQLARAPVREFAIWQALAGPYPELPHITDKGRPLFEKLLTLGFWS